ncbi:MAG: FkbM family methyltransferase [Melioribacteraceae bacterium]|nr:FkbM family methyltransferase [Melioribacteraceae bacterium]
MKQIIKNVFRKLGYDVVKYQPKPNLLKPYWDMARFIKNDKPILFDVGANIGQTAKMLDEVFPEGVIHSFEPSENTFEILTQNVSEIRNVNCWNFALGAVPEERKFFENSRSPMSSFLRLGESGWGEIEKELTVKVKSIDDFCSEQKVEIIDILKIDTQGFELEVLKGAETMIANGCVGLLYMEVTFAKLYEALPSFGELYEFLINRKFKLVTIYPIKQRHKVAGWTDMLFVHEDYIK